MISNNWRRNWWIFLNLWHGNRHSRTDKKREQTWRGILRLVRLKLQDETLGNKMYARILKIRRNKAIAFQNKLKCVEIKKINSALWKSVNMPYKTWKKQKNIFFKNSIIFSIGTTLITLLANLKNSKKLGQHCQWLRKHCFMVELKFDVYGTRWQ